MSTVKQEDPTRVSATLTIWCSCHLHAIYYAFTLTHCTLEHPTIHKSSPMYIQSSHPCSRCTDSCWHAVDHGPNAEHALPCSPDHVISKACEPPCASQLRCIDRSQWFFLSPLHYHSMLSVLLNEHEGIINDTVITKHAKGTFYVVTNTGRQDKNLTWFLQKSEEWNSSKHGRDGKVQHEVLEDWGLVTLQDSSTQSNVKGYLWEYRSKVCWILPKPVIVWSEQTYLWGICMHPDWWI